MRSVFSVQMMLLALVLGACRPEKNIESETTSATVSDTGSTDTNATETTTGSTGGTVSNLSAADKTFVTSAAQAGMAEVNMGNLANQKATNADVKAFAQRMVTDHSKANDELLQLATLKGLALPTEVNDDQNAEWTHLEGLSGSAFDKAYMDHMVSDHEKAVSLFQTQSTGGGDADLRGWATKTLPTLQEHLKLATETKAKL